MVSIVESSDDAIYSYSLKWDILSWNQGAQRVFGYSPEEAIGKNYSLIVPANQQKDYLLLLESVKNGKTINHYVVVRKTKQENEVLLSLSFSPIKDDAGQVTRIAVIARDVTETERAATVKDKLLADQGQLLESFQLQMDCMPIACVLAGPNGHFTYWNPAAEKDFRVFFQGSGGPETGRHLLPPSDLSRAEASYDRLQKGDQAIQGEVSEHRRKDGKTIMCEWHITPLKDSKGTQLGVIGMALDITERLKAERVQSATGGHIAANHRCRHRKRPGGQYIKLEPGRRIDARIPVG